MKQQLKPELVVNEGKHYLPSIVAFMVEIAFIGFVLFNMFFDLITELDVSQLILFIFLASAELFAFYAFGILLLSFRKIYIYKDRVESKTLWNKTLAKIDLTKTVYYTLYSKVDGGYNAIYVERYMVISNAPFIADDSVQSGFGNDTKINMLYTKKVSKRFPESSWKEIDFHYPEP